MKVTFLNATHRKGISAKTNKPYDMANVTYLVPVQPQVSEKMTYLGYGNETREIPLKSDCLKQFAEFSSGDQIDLIVEPDPNYPSRTIVVGVSGVD